MDKARLLLSENHYLRPSDFSEIGVDEMCLYRLLERGEVRRVSRGIYERCGRDITERTTDAMVCKRFPNAVVCLLSALQIYDVTTQMPHRVWIAVDQNAWRPMEGAIPIRLNITYMSGNALTEGVTEMTFEGVKVRVFNLAKTVADCFKFRNKVGIDVAIEALKEVRRNKLVTSDDLWHYIRICRMTKVMMPYMEAIW
jgi:predicted transcriptional regulator of viral defense system